MSNKFGSIAVTPPEVPMRDARRPKEVVFRFNKEIREVREIIAVEAVEADEEEGIEAVAAVKGVVGVPAIPAGEFIDQVEMRFAKFSSTNEKRPDRNPDGVVSQGGANLYKGDNCVRVLGNILSDTAAAEIMKCIAEDNIDE